MENRCKVRRGRFPAFFFLLLLTLILLSGILPAGAAYELPDGGIYHSEDDDGNSKQVKVNLLREDGLRLKTLILDGPANKYFVGGLVMWGYEPVKVSFPSQWMVSVKLTDASDNCWSSGQAYYTQIGAKFLPTSKSTYEGTIYYAPMQLEGTVKHIRTGADGAKELLSTSSLSLEYDADFFLKASPPAHHTLDAAYTDLYSEPFTFLLLGQYANMTGKGYGATFHSPSTDGSESPYYDHRTQTVEFLYHLDSYPIVYRANGGTGAPEDGVKYYGVVIDLSHKEPVREGYTFLGWSTDVDAVCPQYLSGSRYSVNAPRILYAVWSRQLFVVRFDANGGSGAPSAQMKIYGEALSLTSYIPVRDGYTFLGWAENQNATVPDYLPGGLYTADAGVTLYAVWQKNAPAPTTYEITYDANGGTGAPGVQIKEAGVALQLSMGMPQREGYLFVGWAETPGDSQASYYPGSMYRKDESVCLYAVWSPERYTVTLNRNGGTGGPDFFSKTRDVTARIPSTSPTRDGYTFLGWAYTQNSSAPAYFAGGEYREEGSRTLYAVWEKESTVYTVTYDADGGTGAPEAQTKYPGENLVLSTQKPKKTGYSFDGWSLQRGSTYPQYRPGDTYKKDVSAYLYPVWVRITYEIFLFPNGAEGSSVKIVREYGEVTVIPDCPYVRDGYAFIGWARDKKATKPNYRPGARFSQNYSLMLYALWEPKTYTVSFDAGGGTGSPEPLLFTGTEEKEIPPELPERTGFTFLSWMDGEGNTFSPGDIVSAADFSYKDTTLYATWRDDSYDISLSGLILSKSSYAQGEEMLVTLLPLAEGRTERLTSVPVEFYASSQKIGEETIDLSSGEARPYTFSLDAPERIGDYVLTVRIHFADKKQERRGDNNEMSASFSVVEGYRLTLSARDSGGEYREGSEAIISFRVTNDSSSDLLPSNQVAAVFTLTRLADGEILYTTRRENAVCPGNGENLIWFPVTIPEDTAGELCLCEGALTVLQDGREEVLCTDTAVIRIQERKLSQTENEDYFKEAPASYNPTVSIPERETVDVCSWEEYVFSEEEGKLTKKEYRVVLLIDEVTYNPSDACLPLPATGGEDCAVRSGYGLKISVQLSVESEKDPLPAGALAGEATVSVYLPEKGYREKDGDYRVLEKVGEEWCFYPNEDSLSGERVHYLPIYLVDGEYRPQVYVDGIFVPGGALSVQSVDSYVRIDGCLFDDYYWA